MKCGCGTQAKNIKTDLDLFDGEVIIKNVDGYYCPKCKEEIFTSDQAEIARGKLKDTLPGFEAFKTRKKVAMIGNSFSIPIPKDVADFVHLKKGEEIRITVKSRNRLIVDIPN